MPGAGLYTVGKNGTYAQVQDAIAQLVADQGVPAFSATQTIRIVSPGIYNQFSVPFSLTPTPIYRLVIESSVDDVYIRSDGTSDSIGATIYAPNVTLSDFTIDWVWDGIVLADSASGTLINKMQIKHFNGSGIVIWNSGDTSIYNSIIAGFGYGIVINDAINVAINHNTIVLVREESSDYATQKGKACVLILQKTGDHYTHLMNNNLIANAGVCIALVKKSLSWIVSDYNNVVANGNGIGRILESGSEAYIRSIENWRNETGLDLHSTSEDPRFVSSTAYDFRTQAYCPLSGVGIDITGETWYVETSELSSDMDGTAREDPPTIGPYEVIGFDFDVYQAPSGETDPYSGNLSLAEAAIENSYAGSTSHWKPSIGTGFFFCGDSKYYLYADKQAKTLGQITWRVFDLTGDNTPDSITITTGSATISSSNWYVHGNQLVIKGDAGLVDSDSINIEHVYKVWDTGEVGFVDVTGDIIYGCEEGTKHYVLEPWVDCGAPIVVTDSWITKRQDTNELPLGYDIEYNDTYGFMELLFQHTNLLSNPIFHNLTGDLPDNWVCSGATIVDTVSVYNDVYYPRIGKHFLLLETGDISCEVSGEPNTYTLGLWAFPTTGDVDVTLDINGDSLTFEIDEFQHITLNTLITGDVLDITISTNGSVGIEGVQLEVGEATRLNWLPSPDDMTIEWEGSSSPVYVIDDLNLNPIANALRPCFICIRDIDASRFDSGISGEDTILGEWDWQNGRLNYLPWAKLSGINKWRPMWREESAEIFIPIWDGEPSPSPEKISVSTNPIVVAQGGGPEYITVSLQDVDRNPVPFYPVEISIGTVLDLTGDYAGTIYLREFGLWKTAGVSVTGETDGMGNLSFMILPPEKDSFILTVDNYVTGDSYFDAPFIINSEMYGNPIIYTDYYEVTPITGDVISETLTATQTSDWYVHELTYYPSCQEDIRVTLSNKPLNRVYSMSISDDEFYVDYSNKKIYKSKSGSVDVEYVRSLIYIDPSLPNRFQTQVSLPTHFNLEYNAEARIDIEAGELSIYVPIVFVREASVGELNV